MRDVIIGGSSGLGLELAKLLSKDGERPIITGRTEPEADFAEFYSLPLSGPNLIQDIATFAAQLPPVRRLILCAGFYQEGSVDALSDTDIESMLDVGARTPIYLCREILRHQSEGITSLIFITSSSQFTARPNEPIYCFVKAGLAHFARCMSEDGRVHKTLIAAPAGMDTPFWEEEQRKKLGELLDAKWVARQIVAVNESEFKFKEVHIKRNPPEVVEIEVRNE